MFYLNLVDHQYFKNDTELTSVTQILKKYEQDFDKEFWLLHTSVKTLLPGPDFMAYASQYKGKIPEDKLQEIITLYNITPEELAQTRQYLENKWAETKNKGLASGSTFDILSKKRSIQRGHETCFINGLAYEVRECTSINPGKIISTIEDYNNIPPGAYPDFMIYNEQLKLAGTMDWMFMNPDRSFYVNDLKRNKNFSRNSGMQTYKSPIHRFKKNEYNYAHLQVLLYAYLLTQFGYTCKSTWILNHNHKGYTTAIHPYKADIIEELIDHYAEKTLGITKKKTSIVFDELDGEDLYQL